MSALSRVFRREGNGRSALALPEVMETSLGRMGQEMDDMFDRFWRTAWQGPMAMFGELAPWAPLTAIAQWPAIDVAEDEKAIVIKADLPGLEAKDVAVEVADNVLTIRGSRTEEASEKTAEMSRHERQFGRFERQIALPSYIDAEKIEAKYDKGTLSITIAKVPGAGPKRVPVQTA